MSRSKASRSKARRGIAAGALAVAAGAASCALDLGDAPFACSQDGSCPEGYTCIATECVAAGKHPAPARPMRITFINSAEMYWFASPKGGATLVVNDGFSAGAHGLYEIHVAEDGTVSGPTKLLAFGGEFPTSTALVALDDTHYGALALAFPNVEGNASDLSFTSIEREASGHAPATSVLYDETVPYLGGAEPSYVSAVIRGGEVVSAFTNPAAGGQVEIERRGLGGDPIDAFTLQLPGEVLPLSGDCLLWKTASDGLVLRLGLDVKRLFTIDLDAKKATELATAEGLPMYGFDGAVVWLETPGDGTATYVVRDTAGKEVGRGEPGAFMDGLEPYTGVASTSGALFAPISTDPAFANLDVDLVTPSGSISRVATFAREPGDALYSARPFVSGGHAYLAWTSFHESLMDLWVAVQPAGAS